MTGESSGRLCSQLFTALAAAETRGDVQTRWPRLESKMVVEFQVLKQLAASRSLGPGRWLLLLWGCIAGAGRREREIQAGRARLGLGWMDA